MTTTAPATPAPLYERLQMIALPRLLRAARKLPRRPAVGLIVAAGVAQALGDPWRLTRAIVWASAHRRTPGGRAALLVRLLVNRGRFLAWSQGLAPWSRAVDDRHAEIQNRERLDRALAAGGALIVSFHLGPEPTTRELARQGYDVVVGSGGTRFAAGLPPSTQPSPHVTTVSWHDTASRATGLYRLADALRRRSLVVLPADSADDGRVEFKVPLPGRTMAIRSGWFLLRRLTNVPAFPALQHMSGGRRIVCIHPPLPPPDPDVDRDRENCRAHLVPILGRYVTAHPEQCVSLAFRPDGVSESA